VAARGYRRDVKVLVIASEPVDAGAVHDALGEDAALADAEIRVVCPALNDSRLAYWVDDPDEAIERAEQSQAETVQELSGEAATVSGDTGDSDPLQAIEDALVQFPAERIVIFAHPEAERAYREDELVEEVRERFGLPVTVSGVARED